MIAVPTTKELWVATLTNSTTTVQPEPTFTASETLFTVLVIVAYLKSSGEGFFISLNFLPLTAVMAKEKSKSSLWSFLPAFLVIDNSLVLPNLASTGSLLLSLAKFSVAETAKVTSANWETVVGLLPLNVEDRFVGETDRTS